MKEKKKIIDPLSSTANLRKGQKVWFYTRHGGQLNEGTYEAPFYTCRDCEGRRHVINAVFFSEDEAMLNGKATRFRLKKERQLARLKQKVCEIERELKEDVNE